MKKTFSPVLILHLNPSLFQDFQSAVYKRDCSFHSFASDGYEFAICVPVFDSEKQIMIEATLEKFCHVCSSLLYRPHPSDNYILLSDPIDRPILLNLNLLTSDYLNVHAVTFCPPMDHPIYSLNPYISTF